MAHKITAITVQKHNPQRVNIFLDGEFAFGLARIVAAWLQVGQELSDEEIARLRESDAQEQAYQRALRYVGYRPRTEAELRRYLAQRGAAEAHIEAAIARLRDLNLVDDTAFAHAWVADRITFHPRGRRALRAEMRQKGLAEDTIDQTLENIDEAALAYQAAQKGVRRYRNLEWPAFRQKMTAYLARRGFPYSIVQEAVQRVWQETHPDFPSASPAEDIPDNEESPCMD